MKKYRFLQNFLGVNKGDIYEFDMTIFTDRFISGFLELGIIEEYKPKPTNRFLLKAEDIPIGTKYWYIDNCNEITGCVWVNIYIDLRRLANNNVFLIEAECDEQAKRNEAVNKYLKCVARHNEASEFEAKFDMEQASCLFGFDFGINDIDVNFWYNVQIYPLRYYFHKDYAEIIRKELGDECLMLVFGGE